MPTSSDPVTLRVLCGPIDRPHLSKPFKLTTGAGPVEYAVACDGSMFLAILTSAMPPLDLIDLGLVELDADHDSMRKYISRAATGDVPGAVITTVAKILAWAGNPMWTSPCGECEGTGKLTEIRCAECDGDGFIECVCSHCDDSHERNCDECRGTGLIKSAGADLPCDECGGTGRWTVLPATKAEPGSIAGVVVDRRRLARLLSFVHGPCRIWAAANERLEIRGDAWHATLMMLRDEPTGEPFEP